MGTCQNSRARRPSKSFERATYALLLATAFTVPGATFTVNSTSDSGPGSLRQAILDASAGDTIAFAVIGAIKLQSQLEIDKSILINGPGAKALTISGGRVTRVFHISSGPARISDLTIADGSDTIGGGIWSIGDSVAITNCALVNNVGSGSGGGGGAIFNWANGLRVDNSTFVGNIGSGGGAILNYGNVTVRNCTFSGNTASLGGALYNSGSANDLSVWNCTLCLNTADTGGGIDGSARIGSTILAGNSAAQGANCYGSISSQDFNLIDDTNGCTLTGLTSHNIIGVDPLLGPLRDNRGPMPTHALRYNSPALDQGSSFGAATDQLGKPRIVDLPGIPNAGDGCDIGAGEREDELPDAVPSNNVTTLADSGPGSLRQAISDAVPGATLTFAVTGTISLTSTELTIATNLVLAGPGPGLLTISGEGARRIFDITGGDVSITGVTLANGFDVAARPDFQAQGGAIRNAGRLTISNAVLTGNLTKAPFGGSCQGGAIYNSGTLTMLDCTLSNNQANVGFNGSPDDDGGAIFNEGSLSITNVMFHANSALGRGGCVFSSGQAGVSNCFFFANSAGAAGGGIYNATNGTLDLVQSELSTNTVVAGSGGGLNNAGSASVFSSVLCSNLTDMGGSGIANSGQIGITNCTFRLNYCVHGGGGGLQNARSMALEGSLVESGWVSVQGSLGGGIANWGVLTVNHSTIRSNTAPIGGGIGNEGAGAVVTVENSTLNGNFAMSFGGGLYTWSPGTDRPTDQVVATLRNTTISGNTAQKKRTAGGVDATTYAGIVIVNLDHCTIVSNISIANSYPAAGGIYVGRLGTSGSATVKLFSSIVADNLTPYLPGSGQVLPDSGGVSLSQGYNLCGDDSANLVQPTDKPSTEPRLGPLQDNGGPTWTHALLSASPAIDAGSGGGLATDQRGHPRGLDFPSVPNAAGGDGSDIGAFELDNRITKVETVGADVRVTFVTTTNQTYRVESSPTLSPSVWTAFPGVISGMNGQMSVIDPSGAAQPQRFYRVVVQ